MTKEKIIEIIVRHSKGRHFNKNRKITQEDLEDIADELLTLVEQDVEQEKNETVAGALKIVRNMHKQVEKYTGCISEASLRVLNEQLDVIAKEYGVKL